MIKYVWLPAIFHSYHIVFLLITTIKLWCDIYSITISVNSRTKYYHHFHTSSYLKDRSLLITTGCKLQYISCRSDWLPGWREAESDGVVDGVAGEEAGAVVVGVAVGPRARRLEDGRVGRRAARSRRRVGAAAAVFVLRESLARALACHWAATIAAGHLQLLGTCCNNMIVYVSEHTLLQHGCIAVS